MHIFSNVFFFLIRGLPQTDKRSQQKTQRLNFVFVSLEHCQDMYGMRSMSTQLAIALLPFYKCGTTSHATARATKSTTTLQKRSKTKKKQKNYERSSSMLIKCVDIIFFSLNFSFWSLHCCKWHV